MKRQVYDYSGFSLRNLRDKRFSHVLLLAGWIGYFSLYFITENLIPAERCHVIHCALDDRIPFREEFVVIYVAWYLLVAGTLAYTLFFNVKAFRKVQVYIMITQAIAMAFYILYPSIQNLRPHPLPRENVFCWILRIIYDFDTPTGVFPSLHVAYSVAILSVAWKDRELSRVWKIALFLFTVAVSFAVCFVKQHSALDVASALPVCLVAEVLVFGKDYWLPKCRASERKTA